MNSQNLLSGKLEKTWNYNLLEILEQARCGDPSILNDYLNEFAPFTAVNATNSILLTLRKFHSQTTDGKQTVLNCHPEGDSFQYGVTITRSSDLGNAQNNIFLPQNQNYSGLKILDNEIQIFMEDAEPVTTNLAEVQNKLQFMNPFTEKELEDAFSSLSNEKYSDEDDDQKTEVKNLLITIPSIGPLIYNEDFEWYEGIFTSDEIAFDVNVYNTAPERLDYLMAFVDHQIQNGFYKNMLSAIEPEMVKLKNETWLELNEITRETETEITPENFRKRVSIDSIIFNYDFSSQIYCHDDDIFWGHQIQITVDKDGKYVGVGLVG